MDLPVTGDGVSRRRKPFLARRFGLGGMPDEGLDLANNDEGTAPVTGAPSEELPPLAELKDVSKTYGSHPALASTDLRIERGCTGLLGPNGAGKTTLLRILMGLMRPDAGEVRVLGERVEPGSPALRRRIGYVPEGEAQFPDLTGIQAVAYAGRLSGMARTDALQRGHQVLDYVGLGEARYRAVAGYSTGMRQRLKIAQALVHDPELLILDEPTEGVDPTARNEILALLDELVRVHKVQVILSTHLLSDVERLAQHGVVLHQGRVVASGPLAQLKAPRASGFVVRANVAPTAVEAQLASAGIRCDPVPGAVRAYTDDAKQVLRALQAGGLVVRHLAPIELSLNEAFEQAVGGAPHA